jgi:5-methylthioadenosine/S-adenosylhomocysteine deaminase
MTLVLTGAVVTMVEGAEPIPDGAVYIDGEGRVEAVQPAGVPPPAGYREAPRIDTGGTLFPGLVELHEHLVFATIPLWTPPATYESRYDWPLHPDYPRDISEPATVLGLLAGEALLGYGQLKSLAGGVTTVQGSVRTTRRGTGWFLRDVENETFGGTVSPAVSVVGPVADADLPTSRREVGPVGRLITHLAEGAAGHLRRELNVVEDAGLLDQRFIGIHANALTADDLMTWGGYGGTLVWSPFTNLWLYEQTADVIAARSAGLRVCLGSDWSPSGTKTVLGELKVAAHLNATRLGGAFTAADLCAMVTRSPAEALGWDDCVGTIAPGRQADITVVRRNSGSHADLISAWEDDVLLVVLGGAPVYGETTLMTQASRGATLEPFLRGRSVAVGNRGVPSPRAVLGELETVRRDPVTARARVLEQPAAQRFWVGAVIAPAGFEDPSRPSDARLRATTFPPFDTFAHDAAFQAKVAARQPGLLEAFRRGAGTGQVVRGTSLRGSKA